MNFEDMQIKYSDLNIQEMDLSAVNGLKGLYYDGNIAVDEHLSQTEKACVCAEELGHHYTSVGNILDQENTNNRKQERLARLWAYNQMVGLTGIVNGYLANCQNRYELAEYLNVTEQFLQETIDCYKEKYGLHVSVGDYIIIFEPILTVVKQFEK